MDKNKSFTFSILFVLFVVLIVMSKIHFMSDPFPDNHNGFDYSPQSETDLHREFESEVKQASDSRQQKTLINMLASIFK